MMEWMTPASVSVEINGVPVRQFRSVRVQTIREIKEIRAFGEAEPVGSVPLGERYRILLEQLRIDGKVQAILDGMDDFTVTFRGTGGMVTYSGCRWEQLESDFRKEPGIIDTAEISARRRTEGT